MTRLAPIPFQGPTEPGTYNVIGIAKIMRSDPTSKWITTVLEDADVISKGKGNDGLLTARDVGDFMTALALAKRRASETMAQSYARLCNGDEAMRKLYAAHEILKAQGKTGKPRNKVPNYEEDGEEDVPGKAKVPGVEEDA